MRTNSIFSDRQLALIEFIIAQKHNEDDGLPNMQDLSAQMNTSVASLREDLESLRFMGVVDAQPKKGMKILPYRFEPVVSKSLRYATLINKKYFQEFSVLRNCVEKSFFMEAVEKLEQQDIESLHQNVEAAFSKLHGQPIQIPFTEHRELHLRIYKRLNNTFIEGILLAYWKIYQAIGLDLYTDLDYLERVWHYHADIVAGIQENKFTKAHQLLLEHMELLYLRTS